MIDWDRVKELRSEVGAADFNDVVDIFLEEVDDAMQALGPGTTGPEDVHFLKGCALSLGFRAVSSLCQRLETSARGGALTGEDIDALRQAYAASRAEFLARLPGLETAA